MCKFHNVEKKFTKFSVAAFCLRILMILDGPLCDFHEENILENTSFFELITGNSVAIAYHNFKFEFRLVYITMICIRHNIHNKMNE